MIRSLSPYYITIPKTYTTSSPQVCEYFKLNIKVWEGLQGSPPSDTNYTIVFENTEALSDSHVINIAPLLRDFIEFTPSSLANTSGVLNAFGNQQWVRTSVEYDGITTPSSLISTDLFSSGYSYGTDGINAESRGPDTNSLPQILLHDTDYSIHRGSPFNVPVSTEELTSNSAAVIVSYPSGQISYSASISTSTNSSYKIKNIWIPTTAATTDEYIRVSYRGEAIDFVLKDEFRFDPMTVFFINKYGAQQGFVFFKDKQTSLEVTGNTFESNIGQPSTGSHQFLRYNVQGRTTIKASSGFIDEGENEAIKQMMLSERVWMYDVANDFTPLNIKTTSTTFKTRQKERLINYDVEFLMGYNEINNI